MTAQINRREMLCLAAAGASLGVAAAARGQEQGQGRPARIGVIGVGGRGSGLLRVALETGVEVAAIGDINAGRAEAAAEVVAKARGGVRPATYSAGPKDYQRLLARDDLEAVIIATPILAHAVMAVDALRAGKHVFSEVPAAATVDECWAIVRATEETGKLYMLAENCCYYNELMMIRNMCRQGLFGTLTFAECGYVHEIRSMSFNADGTLTWRGELVRDCPGNWYPTHAIGPVAQWFDINRGDRMVSLVAAATGSASIRDYVNQRFPADHPARQIQFKGADSVSTLIKTARGALIDLRFDVSSPRSSVSGTTYFSLQGTKGSYQPRFRGINLEGRTKTGTWEPAATYAKEFDDPLWVRHREQAAKAGHGGGDFFVISEFLKAVRQGGPSPIDCYDAAAWSSIVALSSKSIAEGGAPQEIPDFTRGKWESRKS